MTDIVERLRRFADGASFPGNADVMREAADEIERLEEEVRTLTARLIAVSAHGFPQHAARIHTDAPEGEV